jgi:AcrR family transcriptional regulator
MTPDTRERLLRETETLLRTCGYAACSYADLSERVGIRKASIHHHFRTKEDLGAALIDSYLVKFEGPGRTPGRGEGPFRAFGVMLASSPTASRTA